MICFNLLRRLAFAGLALTAAPLFGADVTSTWSAATSGVWNANGNWLNVPVLGGFPNNGNGGVATYDAVISATGPAYTVTLNTNVTVEDLTLSSANATINHTTGTFTATGAISISAGAYQLSGGTISNTVINQSGTGSLLIAANNANLLSGVTVNGDLRLETTSAAVRIAGGTTFTTAHLSNTSAELAFAPGSTLNGTVLFEGASTNQRFVSMNNSAGTFSIGVGGVIRSAAGFAGSGNIGGGGNFGGAMTLANAGLISSQVNATTITIHTPSVTNTGILEAINGGTLGIGIAATNWTNGAGATLRVLSGSTLSLSGAWTNSGALTVDNATLNLGGSFTTAGLNLAGFSNTGTSTVNLTGVLDNSAGTLTLNNTTGSWTLNGGTLSGGTLAFADGKSLTIAGNSNNLLSGVAVAGDLTLSASNARTKIGLGTTFTTAHLSGSQGELGFAPGATLGVTILLEGASTNQRFVSMNGSAGTFSIGAGGVIRSAAGFAGSGNIGGGGNFGGAMTLANAGLISSQVSATTITVNPASLTNTGIIEAINGSVLNITATNWTNGAGATLRALGGSTLNLSGAWANSGALSVDSSTLNLGGTFTTAGLNLASFSNTGTSAVNLTGTLNNAGTLTLNNTTGSWTLNGGTLSGGTLAFADGKSLTIAGNSNNLLSGVAVAGDLTLSANGARTKIGLGTTFTTAHLSNTSAELAFAPGSTLNGTVLFEGASTNQRFVSMNNSAGTFSIGVGGVIRSAAGFAGSGNIGGGGNFGGAMTLANAGLISSQVNATTITIHTPSVTNTGTGILKATNGGTVTINPATSFTNAGTIEAINAGVLSIPNGYTQTAGVTRVNNGTINSTTINLNAGTLEGSGTINATVNSSGIINLNADGTIAGPLNATGGAWNGQGIVTGLTTVSVGTFTIGSGAHLRANGNLNVTGTGMIAAASGTARITGSVSYLSSSNSNFGGIIAGAGKTLTMNNAAATLTLAGANTYMGATTVTAGILKAGITSVSGVSGAFGRNSPVTMANSSSALLDITGFDTQIGSLSGGGTSGGNVTLGAATLTFAGTNTSPAVYSGTISGTGGLAKIGPGTQTLSQTNTYTGRTTVGLGTLRLDFASLATPTNLINSASALTLGGGTLSVLGKTGAGVITSQTLGNVTLSANTLSTIAPDPNNSGAGSTTLTLGNAWTRNPGSTLLIDYSSTNTGTRNVRTPGAVTGTGVAGANGIFGYALVKDSGGTGFAKQDGSFNFIRNTTAGTVLTTSNSVAGTTTTDFTTISTDPGYSGVGGTLTLANVAHAASTLSIDTTGGGTLNLGDAAGVFALTNQAVLVQGAGNYTIQNGALGASGSEVIVHHLGSGMLTISSPISGGAGGLTRDGSGTLALTGLQDYTTLTTGGGITNLTVALGTGSSTLNANARTNLTTSQTLAALNIGDGGVVTLSAVLPAAPADGFDEGSIFADHHDAAAGLLTGAPVGAVPEPGSASLLVLGALALLGRRQRSEAAEA